MADPIAFYFDPTSPYAYLASTQIDDLAARHGRQVDWRPLLLGVTIVQVMGLKPVPQTPLKGAYSRQDKHRLAALLGVPLQEQDASAVSPLPALRAFVWLKRSDPALAARFARRICAALWVQGRDIGTASVVLDEGEAAGVERAALQEALASDDVKRALRQAVDDAVALGVFGVPTFVADGQTFWGVDRLWMLEHWLRHHHWSADDPC
jgi:2-hydroxychromene-2-carboxylate isomerase